MNTSEIKVFLHETVDKVEDVTVLQAFKDMMNTILRVYKNQIVGYEVDGTPITAEELEKIVVASSENAKAGNVISHQELLEQMKNW